MNLDKMVDGRLEHESVINGYHPDRWLTEPATSDRRVHDIVGNEEKCLKLVCVSLQEDDLMMYKLTSSIHHPTRAA
jgi:hypothetical protein